MGLQHWISYLLLIVFITIIEGWFIHRRIANEFDRWGLFILMIMVVSGLLTFLDIGAGGQWGPIAVGFLVGIWILRMIQNLLSTRDKNRKLAEYYASETEKIFSRRGIE